MARAGVLKRSLQGAGIGLIAAAASLTLWRSGALDRLEDATWGWRVRAFAKATPLDSRIKIILLDQTSLDWGKKENGLVWPWPRSVFGPILDFCHRAGAKAVVFDMLYTEPSSFMATDDATFGEAIQTNRDFVGALFLSAGSGEYTNWPQNIPRRVPDFKGLEQWLSQRRDLHLVLSNATFPIPEVATNALLLANVNEQPDPDGVFRRATLFRVFSGLGVPSLSLASFLAGEKGSGQMPPLQVNESWLKVGERTVPIDGQGRVLLRFRATNSYSPLSAAAVIQSELRLQGGEVPVVKPEQFTNAYVFFGLSAPGLLDVHPTPVKRSAPGVEIHATVLDNLLSGSFLRDMPGWCVVLATLFLGTVSGGVVTQSKRAGQSVAAFALLMPIPILAGFVAYALGWWWPIVVTEGAVVVALVGGDLFNYATEGRQRAFLKQAFRHYLGAEVIEQIIEDPSRLKLGGEKRVLTLLFSDIEKFSSFSEKLPADMLTSLLNDYLSDMTDIILEEGGYLDKYIGDAIVAFWNAPADQGDHCIRAVRTVLRCQQLLAERRPFYQEKTGVVLKARIGMHTGLVTVGNMGSRDRFNYTVLGDAANLASRLEGANKVFGTYNLISETTWSLTEGQFLGRELGRIRVVGREQPIGVYEVMGMANQTKPEYVTDFETGLSLCKKNQWQEALKCFERRAEDPPSNAYAALCRQRLEAGIQVWDGIWNLTEK